MLGFPNPAILSAGAGGRTYADWVAHIATRASSGVAVWHSTLPYQDFGTVVTYRTDAALHYGIMLGSSYMATFQSLSSDVSRIIQHGLPSEAVYNAQVDERRQIIFQVSNYGGSVQYPSIFRNGYTSEGGFTGAGDPYTCPLVGWWDEATKSALMTNPQAGTGPVPYTAPGW